RSARSREPSWHSKRVHIADQTRVREAQLPGRLASLEPSRRAIHLEQRNAARRFKKRAAPEGAACAKVEDSPSRGTALRTDDSLHPYYSAANKLAVIRLPHRVGSVRRFAIRPCNTGFQALILKHYFAVMAWPPKSAQQSGGVDSVAPEIILLLSGSDIFRSNDRLLSAITLCFL